MRRANEPPTFTDRLSRPARPGPQQLYVLALEWWREGRRFDIGQLAAELGVGRATVFRWVGSRELLYGEVISNLFQAALANARGEAQGNGGRFVADVTRRLLQQILEDAPLRTFVRQDPDYAMRILMSRTSTVERRCADTVRYALEEALHNGHIQPAMRLEDLAYLIVRIGESFLYRDAITGDPPEIESAVTAIQLLLTTAAAKPRRVPQANAARVSRTRRGGTPSP